MMARLITGAQRAQLLANGATFDTEEAQQKTERTGDG